MVTYLYLINYLAFNMQNSTGGMNQDCVAAYTKMNETWKCGLADVSLVSGIEKLQFKFFCSIVINTSSHRCLH